MKHIGMITVLLFFILCGCGDTSDRIEIPDDLVMHNQAALTDEQLKLIDELVMTAVDWYNDTDHDTPFRDIDESEIRFVAMGDITKYLLSLPDDQFGEDRVLKDLDSKTREDILSLLNAILPAAGITNSYSAVIMHSASESAEVSWPKMRSAIITALEYYYDIEFEDEEPAA